MIPIHCRFCQSDQTSKAGNIRNKQRYRCKQCKKHFITDLSDRGIDLKIKLQALILLKEGMGFRATARVLGVSFSAVKQWFKDKSRLIKQVHDSQKEGYDIEDVELDELCHFVKKKE